MRILIPGLLFFACYALAARWYFVCEIRHPGSEQEMPPRLRNLGLAEGGGLVLEGYEQFYFFRDSIRPVLNENNREFLREVADYIREDSVKLLAITGNYLLQEADAPSGFFENLGLARAAMVGSLLEDLGLETRRIEIGAQLVDADSLYMPLEFLAISPEDTTFYPLPRIRE